MNDYTCRIVRGAEEIYRSTERGIAPLIAIIDGGIDVAGAVAYDKIVGKAAALLYVLTGVGAVHAGVLGKAAARLFDENGIAYTYETLTENIINRKGNRSGRRFACRRVYGIETETTGYGERGVKTHFSLQGRRFRHKFNSNDGYV